jgi:hypothetical protein
MKFEGYLHVGLQKTGTTSIQQFLFENNELLQEHGLYYPHSLGKINHSYIAACAQGPNKIDDIRLSLGVKGPADIEQLRDQTLRNLDNELQQIPSNVKCLVMSNEHIHGRITAKHEVRRLRDFVGSFCHSTKVIIYLRRQDRLAVSLYSTRFRAGSTELKPVFSTLATEFYDYKKILDQFSEEFGADNIIIRIFDKSELRNHDLFEDFCEILGLSIDSRYRRPAILNQPLVPEAIRFFAELNKHIPRFADGKANPDFSYILNAMDSLFCGHGAVVNRALAQQFYEQFKASNEAIRKLYFPKREVPIFDEKFDDYPEEVPAMTYSYEDAVRLSGEILKFIIKRFERR